MAIKNNCVVDNCPWVSMNCINELNVFTIISIISFLKVFKKGDPYLLGDWTGGPIYRGGGGGGGGGPNPVQRDRKKSC